MGSTFWSSSRVRGTQNELDAAKLVTFNELNVQDQPKRAWPAAFVLSGVHERITDA